jgi:hypothetical protein
VRSRDPDYSETAARELALDAMRAVEQSPRNRFRSVT